MVSSLEPNSKGSCDLVAASGLELWYGVVSADSLGSRHGVVDNHILLLGRRNIGKKDACHPCLLHGLFFTYVGSCL
jgi:hypothetical protein